ncbi:hypothetical protein WDW37_00300 [Bdellovibrionota bacterium FG-1]
MLKFSPVGIPLSILLLSGCIGGGTPQTIDTSSGLEISEISLAAHSTGATLYWQANWWSQQITNTIVRGISIPRDGKASLFKVDDLPENDGLSLSGSASYDSPLGAGASQDIKQFLFRSSPEKSDGGRSGTKYSLLNAAQDKPITHVSGDPHVEQIDGTTVFVSALADQIHVQTEAEDGSLVDQTTYKTGPIARIASASAKGKLAIAFAPKTATCDGITLFDGCAVKLLFSGSPYDLRMSGVPLAVWTDGAIFRVLGANASGKLWVTDSKTLVNGPTLKAGVRRDFTFSSKGKALIFQVSESSITLLAEGGAAGFVTQTLVANMPASALIPFAGGALSKAPDSKIAVNGETIHIAWLERAEDGRASVIQYHVANGSTLGSGLAFDIPPDPTTPPCEQCGEPAEPRPLGGEAQPL